MIVDAHAHLGHDYVFEHDFPLNELLNHMVVNKVDASIVQPGTVIDMGTVVNQHDAIADLSKRMPGHIFGMANPNPHLPVEQYREELHRCVTDLGFVGVKLHPLGHAVDPSGSTCRALFEAASELSLPVMVHTGNGIPWSLPSALVPLAHDFPNLKVVLAHSGGMMFMGEAVMVAKLCPNVYLETSWLPSFGILNSCRTLGAHRIMFGSDHPENIATELTKYRTVGLTEEELLWCLGKTAATVFGISRVDV